MKSVLLANHPLDEQTLLPGLRQTAMSTRPIRGSYREHEFPDQQY